MFSSFITIDILSLLLLFIIIIICINKVMAIHLHFFE